MSEIDEWIALGNPAERHLALAAYDDGEQRLEGYQDMGWQAVARFEIWSAIEKGHLSGDFRFWFFEELDRFRTDLADLHRTLAGPVLLRTTGGELEFALSSQGGRGEIRADVILRKIGIDPFEARFGYTFDQSHLIRILRDLNRQFPKVVQ